MSIVVYSMQTNQKNNTSYCILSTSSNLKCYKTSEFEFVVFEDVNNRMGALITKWIEEGQQFHGELLQSMKGSYSLLVYDRKKMKIEVFRSLTANPIFYIEENDKLYVSNHLQSLSQFSRDLDEDYFRMYLHTELTDIELTPYKDIKRLLPGFKMVKDKNLRLKTKKNCFFKKLEVANMNIEEYIFIFSKILKEIVEDSVNNQSVIGCEVSGGLDSSSVSCLVNQLKSKDAQLYGYTYLFNLLKDGKSNREKVDIIYENTDMAPKYLNLSDYWSFKDTEYNITTYDEPSPLILNLAMYRDLHQYAKKMKGKVLFSGEGGDELLMTSSHFLRDLFFRGEIKLVFDKLMEQSNKRNQPLWKLFSIHILPALLPIKLRYRLEGKIRKRTWQNTGFDLNWYHTPTWIGDCLKKIDYTEVESERQKVRDENIEGRYLRENFERMILVNPCPWLNNNISRPFGLSRIYPFRDERMIEYLFALPPTIKLEISENKRCIKEGLQHVIPKETLISPDRSRFIEIFRKGFYIESRFVNELIQTSRAVELGWIDRNLLRDAVEKFKYGFNNEVGLISKTFGLELWLRHQGF
ncbi:Asparagine synthase [Seinonella peptonophila]|uniref:asparagine synthase (glutamine-hydrolyzing) n=1 Tax=Seinonella peptonophila TaxID=112248 RepID=A0A1M5AWQ8_9BACL|nr:asparagine synthase C-terminal domain-containing protein [Seinonella peptonophila]SHF34576.1 Asparagine synthase [Seinonella peptonophila]